MIDLLNIFANEMIKLVFDLYTNDIQYGDTIIQVEFCKFTMIYSQQTFSIDI